MEAKKLGPSKLEVGDGRGNVQCDRDTQEPLFGGSILGAVVDLFPEGEVVVCAAVEVTAKGDAGDAVEHDVGELWG